jgi:hypothetical protein
MGDDDLSAEAIQAEMLDASQRLRTEIATRNRTHLNAATEAIFLSHAGQPIAEVLMALWAQANTSGHDVTAAALVDAANAISRGRRFAFV